VYARRRLLVLPATLALAAGIVAVTSSLAGGRSGPEPFTAVTQMPPQVIHNGAARLAVHLSGKPAKDTVRPKIHPAVAGSWSDVGDAEVFTPAASLVPCGTYTFVVPPTTAAAGMQPVPSGIGEVMKLACPPARSLQRALARLGYLPYHLHGASPQPPPGPEPAQFAATQVFDPPSGRLVPDLQGVPQIAADHQSLDETTIGALMAFQDDHHLNVDGSPGAKTWGVLMNALVAGLNTHKPYTWVTVTESSPETLEVHRGRHILISTETNTGVPGADTPQGDFPIFARTVSATMSGTDPNGSSYQVTGVPFVNYFNGGDAIHGYNRSTYGTPQSNGCVEIPISTSQEVYAKLRIGDVVEIT
jgi:peptidoglycan hydrolase-like protein with peptidoglycan-binding domain